MADAADSVGSGRRVRRDLAEDAEEDEEEEEDDDAIAALDAQLALLFR